MAEFIFTAKNVDNVATLTLKGSAEPHVLECVIDMLQGYRTGGCVVCGDKSYTSSDFVRKKLTEQANACDRIKNNLLALIGDCEDTCGGSDEGAKGNAQCS